jgi:hypothetical protein
VTPPLGFEISCFLGCYCCYNGDIIASYCSDRLIKLSVKGCYGIDLFVGEKFFLSSTMNCLESGCFIPV